jgi:hypothetical protein
MRSLIFFIVYQGLMGVKTTNAQTGTYYLEGRLGASCTVAVRQSGNHISADIFAWWGHTSERNGNFSGSGVLNNNSCKLNSEANDDACMVNLTFNAGKLQVSFNDCMADNLPGDFNGSYTKITAFTPGRYKITKSKCYFYSKADLNNRRRIYLVAGDQVKLDVANIKSGGWAFINFRNRAGKITSGYVRLADLGPAS